MHSGYSPELIDKKFVKVAKCKRKDVLKTARRKTVQKGRKINFVTGYDPTFPDIRKAIRAFEHILRADEECNRYYQKGVSEWHIKEHIKTSRKW